MIKAYDLWKRTFDVLYATLGLSFSCIPLFWIACAVKLSSPGPVIFRQTRIGRNGRPFVCYKIRTMRADTPECATADLAGINAFLTPVGGFLRKYSLDELTQLLNVLRGDMSLVGPRPVIPAERELHRLRNEKGVYSVRPGISGLSQIKKRDFFSDRDKAETDALYAREASPWLDLAILLRTLGCIRH